MTCRSSARPANLGATPLVEGGCEFVVWAPKRKQVEVVLVDDRRRFVFMERDALGYWRTVSDAKAGTKYLYRLDGSDERPDPASRFQPDGVHGPSEIVDVRDFAWTDGNWRAPALEKSVFYELHVGTFTPEGTFEAVTRQLDRLMELGITTIELMPIAQFPGAHNWGYDGTYPYAVQNTYGSPRDLQKLVDAAHGRGIGVALDVVYNHLGPEGNYLSEFGPYFTEHYRTPWGAAINFDGPDSDEVRHFFIQNALYWLEHFHVDVLRLDAIHGIFDASAFPFLAELSSAVESLSVRLGRSIHLIAESDQNDARVLRCTQDGGFGMQGVWSDDFHHAVHTLLTGEQFGYYADFGKVQHLVKTLRNGWCYAGEYSCYRKRKHGNTPPKTNPARFMVCNQNHDQVGNRAFGERLSRLVTFEDLKLAAGITLLSPFTPLLFMGEEYGETAPFQYFTSHGDEKLAEAVRQGRRADFQAFEWAKDVPDPQAEETFAASKLNQALAQQEPHRTLRRFYQMLLRFRREHDLSRAKLSVTELASAPAVLLLFVTEVASIAAVFNFGKASVETSLDLRSGCWEKRVASGEVGWLGPGSSLPSRFALTEASATALTLPPRSFAVFECLPGGDPQ
jgi:maltooligosyltrehalose trehalohydrolase